MWTGPPWLRGLRDDRLVQLLGVAAIVTLSLFLLASGLERWRYVAFVHDGGASRSPLPYGDRLAGWARVVSEQSAARSWYLAIAETESDRSICEWLHEGIRAPRRAEQLTVLHAVPANSIQRQFLCSLPASPAATVPVLVRSVYRVVGDTALRVRAGFVVLDSSFRVVYGSRRVRDLERVAAVLDLFQSADTAAAPTPAEARSSAP